MAESESGSWGSWGQGWGGASSWGGSSWFDEPVYKPWSRSTWSTHQPQEEPGTSGEPWAAREARVEAKVEELAKVVVEETTTQASTEELAEERRRRIEAEAALTDERSGRERAEAELAELKLKLAYLEERLATAEARALEAGNARAAAEAEAAAARASAEAATAEAAQLKASRNNIESSEPGTSGEPWEARETRVEAKVEDWWTSNPSDTQGSSWGRGWSSTSWPSPSDDDSWQKWGASAGSWSSPPEQSTTSGNLEVVEERQPGYAVRDEVESTQRAAHEEVEPESEKAPDTRQDEKRHPHENEEWYQKWLRRQQNRPRQTVELSKAEERTSEQHHVDEGQSESAVTPGPGKNGYSGGDQPQEQVQQSEQPQPNFEEEQATLVDSHSNGESHSAPPEDSRKAYENEEWYQKWLRRQKNKPRQIIELGVDKPQEQQGGQQEEHDNTVEKAEQGSETASPAPQTEESGKRGYEHEEWYQKWLRRQKNKGREIIEIGVDRPQEPEEPEDPSAERRLDPEDGKTYSWVGLYKRYKGHFSDPEIKEYWETDCKVVEASGEGESATSQTVEATDQKVEDSTASEQHADTHEANTAEPEKKPHEQEEWYQKWLRRQANKDRKIIEIG